MKIFRQCLSILTCIVGLLFIMIGAYRFIVTQSNSLATEHIVSCALGIIIIWVGFLLLKG